MSNKSKNSKVIENIKLGASTLVSNNAVVEMGRTRHWYSAILAGVLALVLAAVPIMVSQFSVQGGNIMNSPTYSLDDGLICFQEDLNKNGTSMLIDAETNRLSVEGWSNVVNNKENNSWKHDIPEHGTILEVFWTPTENESYENYLNEVVKPDSITHNYIVFNPTQIRVCKFSSSTILVGQFNFLAKNFDIADLARKNAKGESFEVTYDTKTSDNITAYHNASREAWTQFFTDSYHTYKISAAWTWTGIMFGVYAGFVVLMGLLIFLMTRGKNNPYRIYTFWETQKMAYWAGVSPAAIGLLLSFMMPQMTIFGFIFCYGMRILWLSMKTIRPQ